MYNKITLLGILYFCFFVQKIVGDDIHSNFDLLEHKNGNLTLYLDQIRYNLHEKMGILPHILNNPQGVYLEIGTGGDSIVEILLSIPSEAEPLVIASDIDANVLAALPQRHPLIQQYMQAQKGPRLELRQLDATDMSMFQDNFFNGINGSAVVHEIISYAGGFDAFTKFFQEVSRTLKLGGVFVYRDPEFFSDHDDIVSLSLKNRSVRLFAHIFLVKFLDERPANVQDKFSLYHTDDVMFTFFKKDEDKPVSLDYEAYLATPSWEIDFSRKYIVTLPSGLCRELGRHYLTYLHQCNPLVYVKCTPDLFSDDYKVNYLAYDKRGYVSDFLANNELISQHKISRADKIKIDRQIEETSQVLEEGILLHLHNDDAKSRLRSILADHGFAAERYVVEKGHEYYLDYRLFGLLYDELYRSLFDLNNRVALESDEEHARWLKREGGEYYFYLSPDELITAVLVITQQEIVDDQGNKRIQLLCPLSADTNCFIERVCYSELLKSVLDVEDSNGYEVNMIDGKRIITFSKMFLEDALVVCNQIVKNHESEYKLLQKYISCLQKCME